MKFHPLDYAKTHPWATGIILVVGGFIFIMIVRGSGGGSGGAATVSGPSDAEIAANAQVQAAQIAANAATSQASIAAGAQTAQYNAQVSIANTAADVEKNQDNLTAEIYKDYIDTTGKAAMADSAAKASIYQSILGVLNQKKVGKNKAGVLQSITTGQVVNLRQGNSPTGNSASDILGSLFGSGGIGGTISSIGSIF